MAGRHQGAGDISEAIQATRIQRKAARDGDTKI